MILPRTEDRSVVVFLVWPSLAYGKRLTARRMGIAGDAAPRDGTVAVDAFGLERLDAHAAGLGKYGTWSD